MCPLYVSGLIGPGDRKSIQTMADRIALREYDRLHHFIAAGGWDAAPVKTELLVQADMLVGGSDAVLVIDDTAIPLAEHPRSDARIAENRFATSSGTSKSAKVVLAAIV